MMARSSSSSLLPHSLLPAPASSRSSYSIAACTDRAMVIVQSRLQPIQYQVAGPAGVLVESEALRWAKPEGEVSWKLGGTTGCFWIALQRRRHQMAGWVAHGMAIGTLQSLPRSKVRHAHGVCRLPMSLCPCLPEAMRKRLQTMTLATDPGRREHRESGFPLLEHFCSSEVPAGCRCCLASRGKVTVLSRFRATATTPSEPPQASALPG